MCVKRAVSCSIDAENTQQAVGGGEDKRKTFKNRLASAKQQSDKSTRTTTKQARLDRKADNQGLSQAGVDVQNLVC